MPGCWKLEGPVYSNGMTDRFKAYNGRPLGGSDAESALSPSFNQAKRSSSETLFKDRRFAHSTFRPQPSQLNSDSSSVFKVCFTNEKIALKKLLVNFTLKISSYVL